MKLAEALILRKDIKKRLEQLRERLKLSALVQEGEEPPENPQELLVETERLLAQMTVFMRQINKTNLEAMMPDGSSLTDALAQRDTLTLQFNIWEVVTAAASPKFDRHNRSEIKRVATLSVADLRQQMDSIAQQRREIDAQIQSINWIVELQED